MLLYIFGLHTDLQFTVENQTVSVRHKDRPRRDSDQIPRGRFGHAMISFEDLIILYGGEFTDGSLSDELWIYDVTSELWSLVNAVGVRPPPLAKHTLTNVGNGMVVVFGGSRPFGEFSSDMYRINVTSPLKMWERVRFRGGEHSELRVVGHTTVYHEQSDSLLVFGGIAVNMAKFSVLSDRLFVFDFGKSYWSEVSYPRGEHYDEFVPMKRAFHSANVIGEYMVVSGGYSHHHNQEETCYDSRVYLYHLGCHTWVSPSVLKTSATSAAPGEKFRPEYHLGL